jgi:hypothetical protein
MYGIRDYHLDRISNSSENIVDVCLQLVNHINSFKVKDYKQSPEGYALYHGSRLALDHFKNGNKDLAIEVTRHLQNQNKKRKIEDISENHDDFENIRSNNVNHQHEMARIVTTTKSRKISKNGAVLCTNERMSNSSMIGFSSITGRYSQWKYHEPVTRHVDTYWNAFQDETNEQDPFLVKVHKFGIIWREQFTKCRLPKPYKVTALNELFIKFEQEIYGGPQLPADLARTITKRCEFLNMTSSYNKTKPR